jgi:3-deoxy-manno-octulosonate cytidylyltransferase (CMP-KDO synthetase)
MELFRKKGIRFLLGIWIKQAGLNTRTPQKRRKYQHHQQRSMNKNDILGIIPARYGSTRFPGKPLADIGGKSMIQRVVEQASRVLPQVVVATDDTRIFNAVRQFGGQVVMTSPDHKSGTDRCKEALDRQEETTGLTFTAVVNIQGDEPFIEPEQLENLIGCFDQEETQIATLVKPLGAPHGLFDANKPKVVIGAHSQALYFSRSPIPFLRGVPKEEWHLHHRYYLHIGLYAYRSETLRAITQLKPSLLEVAESLEQLRWLENGFCITTSVTDHESYSIDTPEDLENLKRKGIF